MTNIPDGLPTLGAGPHPKNSGGACVMEYVSVITGSEWTDFPACTNRIIARVAQSVNDYASDDERQKLVPFISRLAAAGGSSPEFEQAALLFLSDRNRTNYERDLLLYGHNEQSSPLIILSNWVAYETQDQMSMQGQTDEHGFVMASMKVGLSILEGFLNLHERLVPHEVAQVSTEALADAKRLIETKALLV